MVGQLNLSKAQSSDYTNTIESLEIPAQSTDGVQEQEETEWSNSRANDFFGYFNQIPDLKNAIIMKAIWNVGKGYTADPETKVILDHIKGYGKDTFRDVLFNMEMNRRIYGDAYAEIIRDTESKELVNIKVLDPATMKIIRNRSGAIIRYEQTSKIPNRKVVNKFKPEDIFHISNNKVADQIHGLSDIEALESTILADQENFLDLKKLMHAQARPLILWKLKTDDQAKISAFVSKINEARKLGEDMFIPDDESIVTHEIVQINISQAIFEWRNDIRNKFYRTIGLPQIVPGAGGQSTESESKVIYTAFQQIVQHDQNYLQEQVWNQLYLKINLIHPESIIEELRQDTAKDGGLSLKPSE